MNNFYIYMSPLTGMVGYGGGGTGLSLNSSAAAKWYGDRGVWFGGLGSTNSRERIDYVTLSSTGNAQDFGDLLDNGYGMSGCSNATRGISAGAADEGTNIDTIEYITFASLSNSTNFGNLTIGRGYTQGCADGLRGVFFGGITVTPSFSYNNEVEYIIIDSASNATDFGDMTNVCSHPAVFADSTRAVAAGGGRNNEGNNDDIDYLTIQTLSNCTDFGNSTTDRSGVTGTADETIGMIAGAYTLSSIDKVTIQTTANATDWGGSLSGVRATMGFTCNGTRAVSGGGKDSSGPVDTMDYFTVTSASNASDFGNLDSSVRILAAASGD